ncbi:hypothetical protein J2W34_004327 [Variovorax boronicumulans]|uniref:hypothetical protein n=1 Tax=Variovorax boronicumulans TaxID=436515 RepID=UPI002780AD9C|nr:hypothetical protein [Variovorax boronicumulans]MDQ0072522.1 hypothetical protein [Variovorax boronicumulans]
MRLSTCLSIAILINVLSGCASETRRFAKEEEQLHTNGTITSRFHAALYYPNEVSPKFDGYLVGIEKIPRKILGGSDRKIVDANDVRLRSDKLKPSDLDDGRLMMVTHIIKSFSDVTKRPNCFVFNAYRINSEGAAQLAPDCKQSSEVFSPLEAYANGWLGMSRLSTSLAEDLNKNSIDAAYKRSENPKAMQLERVEGIGLYEKEKGVEYKKYTHVIVVVLGWNTPQEQAVRNINSIAISLINERNAKRENKAGSTASDEAGVSDFRPLIIGVTWPSEWTNSWADPLVRVGSFPTKADDADEVGMTWLGVLLHKTIPEAIKQRDKGSPGVDVIVVGHSFGSRAASVAACLSPYIVPPAPQSAIARQNIHSVINFQGAFMTKRIMGSEGEAPQFADCSNVGRFVLTASKHDAAVKVAFWGRITGRYAGDSDSFREYCRDEKFKINCGVASADGRVELKQKAPSNIFYIDADDLITENAYETGGGAHSDIYRAEHGRFISHALESFAK